MGYVKRKNKKIIALFFRSKCIYENIALLTNSQFVKVRNVSFLWSHKDKKVKFYIRYCQIYVHVIGYIPFFQPRKVKKLMKWQTFLKCLL